MNENLDALCQSLDAIALSITSGWSGEQTFCEAWGWNCPAVTKHDAAAIATSLAAEIRAADIDEIDEATEEFIDDLPRTLKVVQTNTIPQFWGGNNGAAYAAYLGTISSIRATLHPLLGWKTVPDPKTLPGHTIRRLKSIQAEVDSLSPNKALLKRQIEEIAQAHTVAENLPLDLKALEDARQKVVGHADAALLASNGVKAAADSASQELDKITTFAKDAEKLIAQCDEAYRTTTSKGLAAAFDERAGKLESSVKLWVLGLIGALTIGSYLGATRLRALTKLLAATNPNWTPIVLQALLSTLAIGAPIWFAWLATKQVGQNFRLSEDYAFKASVAKAYEGYRREAARIDPTFEARLFSSALTRLEEAPLRLVEPNPHNSPWQEALASNNVQKTIDAIPELRDKAVELIRDATNFAKGGNIQKVPTPKNEG
jgi:hypothetical protein